MTSRTPLILETYVPERCVYYMSTMYHGLEQTEETYELHVAGVIRSISYWYNLILEGAHLTFRGRPLAFGFMLPDLGPADSLVYCHLSRVAREAIEDFKQPLGTSDDGQVLTWATWTLWLLWFKDARHTQVDIEMSNLGVSQSRPLLMRPLRAS